MHDDLTDKRRNKTLSPFGTYPPFAYEFYQIFVLNLTVWNPNFDGCLKHTKMTTSTLINLKSNRWTDCFTCHPHQMKNMFPRRNTRRHTDTHLRDVMSQNARTPHTIAYTFYTWLRVTSSPVNWIRSSDHQTTTCTIHRLCRLTLVPFIKGTDRMLDAYTTLELTSYLRHANR
jgi:hypothetical protein